MKDIIVAAVTSSAARRVARRSAALALLLAPLAFARGSASAGSSGVTSSPHLRPVNPQGVVIPGISQGTIVDAGRLMFLSGHVPLRADGSVVPGFENQLVQVFENLRATLSAAGGDLGDIVRFTFYIRDYRPELLATIRSTRDRYVDVRRPPASVLIGVSALFHPEVMVEIDAIAALKG